MAHFGPRCQSCSMPLSQDPKGGGTEADGSLNEDYCSYCYQAGAFTWPDATMETMKAFVQDKLVEKGQPRWLARLFTAGFHRLDRWAPKED